MLKVRSGMFEESSKSHASPKLISMIVAFIIVFLVMYLFEGIVPSILTVKPMMEEFANMGLKEGETISLSESMRVANKVSAPPAIMIPTLISTVFGTIISMLYCRFGEMRSLGSMGVRKRKLVPHYLIGLGIGTVLMTAIVLLSALFGAQKISFCSGVNFGLIGLYWIGWFFQGMSEEFIFRGYLMNTVGGKHNFIIALTVSSLAFALAHAANPGFGPFVLVNLALFAVFAGLYMILTDDIWGGCAIHSVWNCTQGNLYGISVSGTNEMESVMKTVADSDSKLLTGGDFGIEGSIFTTIVLLAASAIVLYLMKKKGVIEIS
ncbi:MAG: CPBP family intramembrane metalloprotease [Ruminococcus sp.]|nr:CPBP family intramembrane metalloprotease [Ruminococcus sp.]MBP3266795.1 CPBP family intramembrane metalloprotease [Ruminococcus sp.]